MTSLTYIVESTSWIAIGLLVGFFLGRSTVAAGAIADAVYPKGDSMPEDTGPDVKRRRRPRLTATVVLGVVIAALGVFTAVQSYVQSEATERLTACQQAYTDGFADAIDARSQASADAQEALDEWMTKVNEVIKTPSPEAAKQIREAFQEYLDARAEAKETQQDHPYPPAPRDVCREEG